MNNRMIPNNIILHHSLTKDSGTVSWGAIKDFHIHINHYRDIGYHFGIEDMRGVTQIVMGRMPDQTGAHCKGYNTGSIGICFVGNFDKTHPTIAQWNSGIKLVQYLMRVYDIKNVYGHNEFNPAKSCPGKYFDLGLFRQEVGLQ